ncbi:abortive infection family protein [Bartonella harrusi]|uniref:Abortive infection family protein n=1 Tax=Bartonella harrusi TaxID=2961895 RepID=A0ABY5ERI1_9HYPH|nr:abortive infection family protein [Bartonella harrusi]UTO28006.1 abortive infection family protein [Bartonella harrusi]
MKSQIPPAIIGLLSQILPEHYSVKLLNDLFFSTPSAPNADPFDSKATMIKKRLHAINKECPEPLEVLGQLLCDFLEKEYYDPDPTGLDLQLYDKMLKLQRDKDAVLEKLKEYDFEYQRGGYITKLGLLSIEELQKRIAEKGLLAVEIEAKRALEKIEHDPGSAVLFATNLLEASCKAYLDHHSLSYKDTAYTLRALWKAVVTNAKIDPENMQQEKLKNQDLDANDLKMIASGLNKIVQGTMNLRNKKGAAHGHSEGNFKKINLKPRHARLTFNAAHTLSVYILELIDQSTVIKTP